MNPAVDNQSSSRRVAVIEAKAEQKRRDDAAAVLRKADEAKLDLELEQQRLQFKQQRLEARDVQRAKRAEKKRVRKAARKQARAAWITKATDAAPEIGRRAMIAGPIVSPMAVAWIGQIGFAEGTLKWPLVGGVVFAAAWELTTAFTGWMYHQARESGDSGTIFRIATWLFAGSAGLMNYWHALDGGSLTDPTPKAVSFGAMSLTGIALWELYTLLIHRRALREKGKLPAARPRFGLARWTQYTRTTWLARSLSIKHGFTTVDQAWAAALVELDRRARVGAARKAAKKATKAGRMPINVTIVRGSRTRVATPPLGVWRRPPVFLFSTVGPRVDLTARSDRSAFFVEIRSETGTQTGGPDRTQTRSDNTDSDRTEKRSETAGPDRSENRTGTASSDRTRTTKRTGSRTRGKTGPKGRAGTDINELLPRAQELNQAHLQEHGRPISADNLRAAMRIGKGRALELHSKVRSGSSALEVVR